MGELAEDAVFTAAAAGAAAAGDVDDEAGSSSAVFLPRAGDLEARAAAATFFVALAGVADLAAGDARAGAGLVDLRFGGIPTCRD